MEQAEAETYQLPGQLELYSETLTQTKTKPNNAGLGVQLCGKVLVQPVQALVLIPEQAPNETKQNNLVPGAENSGPSDYELPTALGRHAPVLEKMKLKTQANKVQYLNLTGWTSYKVQAGSQLMICD